MVNLMGGGTERNFVSGNPYQLNIEGNYDITCLNMKKTKTMEFNMLKLYTNSKARGWILDEAYQSTFFGSGIAPSTNTTSSGFMNEFLGFSSSDYYSIDNDPTHQIYLNRFQIIVVASDDGTVYDMYVTFGLKTINEEYPDEEVLNFCKNHTLSILVNDDTGMIHEYDVKNAALNENYESLSFVLNKGGTLDKYGCVFNTIWFINKYSGQEEIDKASNDNLFISQMVSNMEQTYSDGEYDFIFK